jgi:hypothetical protein
MLAMQLWQETAVQAELDTKLDSSPSPHGYMFIKDMFVSYGCTLPWQKGSIQRDWAV